MSSSQQNDEDSFSFNINGKEITNPAAQTGCLLAFTLGVVLATLLLVLVITISVAILPFAILALIAPGTLLWALDFLLKKTGRKGFFGSRNSFLRK